MDALDERLARLGRAIAEVDAPDNDAIADARRRWGRSPSHARARRWTLVVAPALVIAATVIAVIVWRSTPDDERSLTFTVGETPGERGQWIAAREPVQLHFSDGSHVEVARNAKVRVAAMDRRGSTIDLEQGALHADVAHRDVSAWQFRTGPYTVLVKGTRFDAAWDSSHERFTLDMMQGTVEVAGPLLPAPVTVSAGQSLVANVAEQRFEIRSVRTADATTPSKNETGRDKQVATAPPDASVPTSTVAPNSVTTKAPLPSTTGQSTTTRHPAGDNIGTSSVAAPKVVKADQPSVTSSGTAGVAPARTEKWRELLAARAYSSAILAAEQRGFDTVVAEATSAELYALSDAARYAGRPARARDALIAARARFGEQGNTAFLLGRIAADQGEASTAIEWFDRYLREQPGGPLAETATGRLIELYRPRDASRARKLAERYLAAYPDGSYAALARTLVEP
jgi:tetratricopeptide (TPR) repeat protein